MRRRSSLHLFLLLLLALATCALARSATAQASQQIYTDSLQNGWNNWSWAQTNLASTAYVHSGSASIQVTYTGAWQAIYLDCPATNTANYTKLTFWINGGPTAGRNLVIAGIINNNSQGSFPLNQFIAGGNVAANSWQLVTVPLSAIGLGKTGAMTGFWIQDNSGGAQPAFYIDDITLVGTNVPAPPLTVAVDFNAKRHAINPLIYGVAFASQAELSDLNFTLNRWGGNTATTHNWQINASNHASDWFFESIADNANTTPGASGDAFLTSTFAARSQALMTIPTLGWVAKLGANRAKTWSFSQAKYGAQTASDGDAGNGILKNGQYVTNDPTDANQSTDSTYQQGWVKHIVSNYGTAARGGVGYYIMDNEPSIWYTTHRDVHPVGPKMSEISGKIIDYAAKVKAVDAGAKIVGPEEWGWSGYFYSGYDTQYASTHGWSNLPDRTANGNMDYMPWLLNQLHQYDTTNKTKSLDVFSLHYYPQSGEFSNDTSTATQLLRNRSTRSLWDPNYTDASWISSNVQLIPRMKAWVNSYYPGLQTAITEYNWGAESHINGATTVADILGIFGREGLDMATYWTVPDPSTPTYKAMKLYRNFDGYNSGFGDTSVSDVASDPDNVSSFAAVRSTDGTQTIMVINKAAQANNVTVTLANCTAKSAVQAWQLTSSNTILPLASSSLPAAVNGVITANLTLPAQSITLYIIPTVSVPSAPTGLAATAGKAQIALKWSTATGATSYNIKRSTTKGGPYTKLATALTSTYTDATAKTGTTYYYVVTAVNVAGESASSTEASAAAK